MIASADGRLPEPIRDRLLHHGDRAPYHRALQREHDVDYASIETWRDLRTLFDPLDDAALREIRPRDLVPSDYDDDALIRSQSSGTTGPVKTVYWHEADVEDTLDYVEATLRSLPTPVPAGTHWVATVTPNPVLQRKLTGLAERFEGSITLVEVDPAPVKRALRSGDRTVMAEVLDPLADRIAAAFEPGETEVYEDIAPLMRYVATRLAEPLREQVQLALVGGVGTDRDTVDSITGEGFPNATLTGWYGDYMTGTSMMHEPASLVYRPQTPDIRLEVRDRDALSEVVAPGETGEVVAHAIRRGFFVPNRRIGDYATRIQLPGCSGITDISRAPADGR